MQFSQIIEIFLEEKKIQCTKVNSKKLKINLAKTDPYLETIIYIIANNLAKICIF